jgi:hypothetical protein
MVRTLSFVCVSCVAAAVCLGMGSWAQAGSKDVIRTLSLDESAKIVELFDGMDSGQLQVRVSPKSPQESYVFVKNTTDEPLTVALPKAAVGVHILPQFFNGQGNNPFNNFGNQNQNQNQGLNNQFGGGGQQGRSQNVGGQFQPFNNNQQGLFNNQNNGNGNGNLNQFQNGNGFFSIPPEKTVQLKMRTVCLDYGLPDPTPGMKYELRRVETEISNPALVKLLEGFTVRVDQDAMQAAAWHLSNNLSWGQISGLAGNELIAFTSGTIFDAKAMKMAQALVQEAEKAAKENPPVQAEDKQDQPVKPAAAPRKLTSKISKAR